MRYFFLIDLRILNGRLLGDSLGRSTFHGKNGTSTVDYIIMDQEFIEYTKYFIVDQPIFLSDHSMISTWIDTTINFLNYDEQTTRLDSLQNTPRQFIWTQESVEPFRNAMASLNVQYLINDFLKKDFKDNNAETVQLAVSSVNKIFIEAASKSLKLGSNNRHHKKKRVFSNKKWFDFECRKAR